MIQFAHTNIITDNWKELAKFYIDVFECKPLFPERDLKGLWLDKTTTIADAHLKGIHLALPGYDSQLPTLEIFQYDSNINIGVPETNRKGFGHIAFRVDNVEFYLEKLLTAGGTTVGDQVETEVKGVGMLTFVYARDIDGNIIEIQSWEQ